VPEPPPLPLREQALFVATELALDLLADDPKQEWLTPEEIASHSEAELKIRVLVRSSNRYSNFDAAAFVEDCLNACDAHTESAVAEARAINHEAMNTSVDMHIDNLRSDALLGHLAAVWAMAPGSGVRHLAAAARDRGFVSIHEAIEAVRPFYLRSTSHRP
jgi:hypothetical protein